MTIPEEVQKKALDPATKALVREQLRRLDLASSIVHTPEAAHTADGFAYSAPSFRNDPVVLDAERRDALEDIQKDIGNLSPIPTNIASKIAALGSAESVLKIRELKIAIQQDIKEALESSDQDKNINLIDLMQDTKYQALWADFHKCEKEIQDSFEKLYRGNKISYDQMHYLRTERERLDALPMDSEARIKDEQKFAEYQKGLGIQVRDDAHERGDHETEKSASEIVHTVEETTNCLKKIHTLSKERSKDIKQETAKADIGMHMSDDDAAITLDHPKEKQGLPVSDVTYHDIQSPSGGKDRSTGKAIAKS